MTWVKWKKVVSILQPVTIAVRGCMLVTIALCMVSATSGHFILSCIALLIASVAFYADDARKQFIRGQQLSCTELSIRCFLLKPFLIPNS